MRSCDPKTRPQSAHKSTSESVLRAIFRFLFSYPFTEASWFCGYLSRESTGRGRNDWPPRARSGAAALRGAFEPGSRWRSGGSSRVPKVRKVLFYLLYARIRRQESASARCPKGAAARALQSKKTLLGFSPPFAFGSLEKTLQPDILNLVRANQIKKNPRAAP